MRLAGLAGRSPDAGEAAVEHALLAPQDGTVSEIAAEAGAQVKEGARLMVIG